METKHTPGPWRACKFDDTKSTTIYSNASSKSLASVKSAEDARLIAAAPRLLQFALAFRDSGADSVGGIDVHELICNATGHES